MFKKVIILVVLSSILLGLVLVRAHTTAPDNDSAKYTMVEYEITNINGNQYYGKGDDGTKIRFSDQHILSGDKIQVHDKVICYFEKNNIAEGLVKVEKKQ